MFFFHVFLKSFLTLVVLFFYNLFSNTLPHKDSFLRALREVALEMELFLENHGQYICIYKNIEIKLKSTCKIVHFVISWKIIPWRVCLKIHSATFFCGSSFPNATLVCRIRITDNTAKGSANEFSNRKHNISAYKTIFRHNIPKNVK